ncbi:Sensor protein ZraS [Novipirellula galeiformis]|uniref:histidine kinase n=1 Tax=Novipirellula galeiformis TaxID=2528004 RepID=A0A5C6CIT9_9BACT|nr:ATP-binding protein [Novipirellula galeiformis]TWU23106.1 Sensor protein ZraS [Novipirellula galeiformis]
MASLFVVRGRDQGKHFQLQGSVVRIGRDKTNTIQLLDTEASRVHAEIQIDPMGGCRLVDLESSNGTLVNGIPKRQHPLASGDRIEIGGSMMIFTGAGQPGAGQAGAMEAAHGVDIVQQSHRNDGSRIISSIAPSSGIFHSRSLAEAADSSGASASGMGTSRILTPTVTDADRSLEVMYLTAIAVGRTDDLNQVLNRILRLVFDWIEADRGCVMLRDNESGLFQPAARVDRQGTSDRKSGTHRRIEISRTMLDYVLEKKEGVRTSDARDDVRFDSAASIVSAGVREAICVPLQGRYDIVGALYVDTYTDPGQMMARDHAPRFTDDHLRLITAIGHQAALAIEDTFYYSALVQGERLAAMGQTIATLSHHIKNILQGIRGGSYLIEAGLERDDTDAVRRGWRIVDRNQERISNLVLDMLTFSKEREPQCVDADLNETVSDVVELMQPRAQELNVSLVTELAEGMPDAFFDTDALHRAILNLVTNAVDATSDHAKKLSEANQNEGALEHVENEFVARVTVKTWFDPAAGWGVDVVDNGPGVPEEDRLKIFSLFESRKGARGTGLGLPVSSKIMIEHGGEIQVMTPANGKGSCFRLRLPPRGTEPGELSRRDTIA